MDILATALGKPDHRGQVRAQPSGVGIKKFFGSSSSRQSYSSQVDISELEARLRVKIREELRVEMMEEMETMMARMLKKNVPQAPEEDIPIQSMANPISTKGSNTPMRVVPLGDPVPDDDDDGVTRSTLCLDDPRPRVVAHAMIFLSSKSHHHRPIPDYCRRVTVTRVVEGEEQTALPMPETGELEVLGDALNGFTLWPKHLIGSIAPAERVVERPDRFPHWQRFKTTFHTIKSIAFKLPPDVVQPHFTHTFFLGPNDYAEFVGLLEIDLSWLELSIWYFHDLCVHLGRGDLYGFFSPTIITHHKNRNEAVDHMLDAASETCRECYFAPLLKE